MCDFSVAYAKKLISIFWHFYIKLDPLTTKMAFFFGFGTLEACKIAYEVCTFEVDSTPSKLLASHTSTVGRLAWLAAWLGIGKGVIQRTENRVT